MTETAYPAAKELLVAICKVIYFLYFLSQKAMHFSVFVFKSENKGSITILD